MRHDAAAHAPILHYRFGIPLSGQIVKAGITRSAFIAVANTVRWRGIVAIANERPVEGVPSTYPPEPVVELPGSFNSTRPSAE